VTQKYLYSKNLLILMPPPTRHITREELASYFHLPMKEATKKLAICPTVLKKICRMHGISRWPHRKLRSLEKKIITLEASHSKGPDAVALKELTDLRAKKERLAKCNNLTEIPHGSSNHYHRHNVGRNNQRAQSVQQIYHHLQKHQQQQHNLSLPATTITAPKNTGVNITANASTSNKANKSINHMTDLAYSQGTNVVDQTQNSSGFPHIPQTFHLRAPQQPKHKEEKRIATPLTHSPPIHAQPVTFSQTNFLPSSTVQRPSTASAFVPFLLDFSLKLPELKITDDEYDSDCTTSSFSGSNSPYYVNSCELPPPILEPKFDFTIPVKLEIMII